jgi:hypothetical protein
VPVLGSTGADAPAALAAGAIALLEDMARLLLHIGQSGQPIPHSHPKEPIMTYTFYDYLDVAPGASPARIDVAYTQLLARFGYGMTEAGQDLSGLIRQIHAAYDVLSNPEKRHRYDADLERAANAADAELKEALDQQVPWVGRIVQEPPSAQLLMCQSLAA